MQALPWTAVEAPGALLRSSAVILFVAVLGFAGICAAQQTAAPAEATKQTREHMAQLVGATLRGGPITHREERAARVRGLVALGASALPAVLDVLLDGRLPRSASPSGGARLREEEREILERVVRTFGIVHMTALVENADTEDARARSQNLRRALELLVHCGSSRDLEVALALAGAIDPAEAAAMRLQADFERAVRGIASRDAGALRAADALLKNASEPLAHALIRGVAASGQPAALRVLAGALQERPALRTVLLSQFDRAARSAPRPIDPWILGAVRVYLRSEDPALVRVTAGAAAAIWDFEAVPTLIELLAAEPSVARGARAALVRLVGADLGEGAAAWSKWLADEWDWREHELPELLDQLRSPAAGKVVVALRAIAAHRYERDELARWIEPCLHDARAGVRQSACEALATLGVPESVALLADLLEDDDLDVARAAWSSMIAITGLRHPPEREAWRTAIGLRE